VMAEEPWTPWMVIGFYLADRTMLPPDPVVLKIGETSAAGVRLTRKHVPTGRQVLYDADPLVVAELEAENFPPDVTVRLGALAAERGPVTFYRYTHRTASSLEPLHLEGKYELASELTVPGRRLVDMLDENGIEVLDLLMMNIEGGELHVFRELCEHDALAARVRQVSVSCHTQEMRRIYEPSVRDDLFSNLKRKYELTRYKHDYWLLRLRGLFP